MYNGTVLKTVSLSYAKNQPLQINSVDNDDAELDVREVKIVLRSSGEVEFHHAERQSVGAGDDGRLCG